MTTSFFDLVRTGAASFDASGFAAEELGQLVHAAMDLLPPTSLADLVADRPFLDHHDRGASWADLMAGHDVAVGPNDGGPGFEHDPFDFGSGALHRSTMLEDVPGHEAGREVPAGHDVHGTPDDHWPHDDLFDDGHDHGPNPGWDHVDHGLHDASAHDRPGLHDRVLHEGGLHDPGHEPQADLPHDPAEDSGPHHDGGWHAE